MSITASTLAFQMRDALIARVTAQMVPGGKVAGLRAITKAAHFSTQQQPALAVALEDVSDPVPYGQNRQLATVMFTLTLAACSTTSEPAGGGAGTGTAANLADATDSIEAVLDDGAGNGLVAILNDPATFALSGNALQSRFRGFKFYPVINEGDQQSVWAYCEVRYSADIIFSY